jgi:hypothetical protein
MFINELDVQYQVFPSWLKPVYSKWEILDDLFQHPERHPENYNINLQSRIKDGIIPSHCDPYELHGGVFGGGIIVCPYGKGLKWLGDSLLYCDTECAALIFQGFTFDPCKVYPLEHRADTWMLMEPGLKVPKNYQVHFGVNHVDLPEHEIVFYLCLRTKNKTKALKYYQDMFLSLNHFQIQVNPTEPLNYCLRYDKVRTNRENEIWLQCKPSKLKLGWNIAAAMYMAYHLKSQLKSGLESVIFIANIEGKPQPKPFDKEAFDRIVETAQKDLTEFLAKERIREIKERAQKRKEMDETKKEWKERKKKKGLSDGDAEQHEAR